MLGALSGGAIRAGPPAFCRDVTLPIWLFGQRPVWAWLVTGAASATTPPHQIKEFGVGLGRLHFVENELHRLDLVHTV